MIIPATLDVERFSRILMVRRLFKLKDVPFLLKCVIGQWLKKAYNLDEDEGFEQLEEAMPRAVVNAVEECIEHSANTVEQVAVIF